MPLSTSSSEPLTSNTAAPAAPEASEPPSRPLPEKPINWLIAIVVAAVALGIWEYWVRSQEVVPGFRNSPGAWAEQRRRINSGEGDQWVFTGSSRVLFNMQLDVWDELDGERPIQLAIQGTSPMSIVEGLADDPDFTGKLLIGVAPGLFFSGFEYFADLHANYRTESPSKWLGHKLSVMVEPQVAFYDSDYALPKILKRQAWPEREGVRSRLDVRKLSIMERDRASYMWHRLETDPEYAELAKSIWAQGWRPMEERSEEELAGMIERRDAQIARAVEAVRKLTDKGVQVVFLRSPSEGHYAISEPALQPRAEYWDAMMTQVKAISPAVEGIHFMDHEALQGLTLPEWSHLSHADAKKFTAEVYDLIHSE